MKLLTWALIGLLCVWISMYAGHNLNQWRERIYTDGAQTGSTVAEIKQTFAQREIERAHEAESAAKARQDHEQQERSQAQADKESHDAVWREIRRQQELEKRDSEANPL
jgi:hypothetical protein